MAQHIYGAEALQFRPQRWLSTAAGTAAPSSTAIAGLGVYDDGAHGAKEAGSDAGTMASRQQPASGVATAPPEPIPFLTGPRDW
jgi:hypothetical protein